MPSLRLRDKKGRFVRQNKENTIDVGDGSDASHVTKKRKKNTRRGKRKVAAKTKSTNKKNNNDRKNEDKETSVPDLEPVKLLKGPAAVSEAFDGSTEILVDPYNPLNNRFLMAPKTSSLNSIYSEYKTQRDCWNAIDSARKTTAH